MEAATATSGSSAHPAAKAAPLRVVHLPTDLGMRAYSLSRAESELGLDSRMIVRQAGVHNSAAIQPLHSPSRIAYLWRVLRSFLRTLRADVIMANQGATLLDFPSAGVELADLPVYRAAGKKIVVTFQGCDVRACEGCPVRASLPPSETCVNVLPGLTYEQFDWMKQRRLRIWRRYADVILGITPDLCRAHGVRYTPHAKYLEEDVPALRRDEARSGPVLRIAHMPKPHIKGTEWIEPQIETMRSRFPGRVEYVPIAGVSWKAALGLLASCDVLIDQVLIGWYGGISVEAALLGVLPIAYIDADLLRFVPKEMRNDLPVLALSAKEELPAVLEGLLRDPERLREEQRRCTDSAMRFHEAHTVAEDLIRQHYGGARPA
jgi:hypothetical protein